MNSHYICLRSYPAEEILSLVYKKARPLKIIVRPLWMNRSLTVRARLSTRRLHLFKKSPFCIKCGKKGDVVQLNIFKHDILAPEYPITAHFNLFHKGEYNEMVLMTKDHIFPLSLGGTNHFNNLQTMCEFCNNEKANDIPDESQVIDKQFSKQRYFTKKGFVANPKYW